MTDTSLRRPRRNLGAGSVVFVLAASFAVFAGNPARADLIFSSCERPASAADGASAGVPADSAITSASPSAPASAAETEAHFAANPDQVHDVGSVEIFAMAVLAIFGLVGYFITSSAHPTPGW